MLNAMPAAIGATLLEVPESFTLALLGTIAGEAEALGAMLKLMLTDAVADGPGPVVAVGNQGQ